MQFKWQTNVRIKAEKKAELTVLKTAENEKKNHFNPLLNYYFGTFH